jgi:hypothetical protein
VLESLLGPLKRSRESENLCAVLDRDHPSRRERMSVAAAIDLIHDGQVEITAPQEIGV